MSQHRLRRWWPLPFLLWLGSGLAYAAGAPAVVPVLATGLAIIWAGGAVGGGRGVVGSLLLSLLAVWWAWWFGAGLEFVDAPFRLERAVDGLGEAAFWHLALFVVLWPLVALIGVIVVRRRRARGAPAWPSLGAVVAVLVVLAVPYRASWSDGCNAHSGAAPLLLTPVADRLMDVGVLVIPTPGSTAALCAAVGDRSVKPFWLGPDGLPARSAR